jgi:protocatechuate 3,4-dioxygenase, alpha subunit
MTDAAKKPEGITPSATVGPFFKYGLTPRGDYPWNDAFPASTLTADVAGERIVLAGRVLDGDGAAVPDAMIEIWQADAAGRFAHPLQGGGANASFKGFARADTAKDGSFRIETIKPGATPGPGGKPQAPHILVALFARGMLRHLYTRIYFADQAAANAADPVLNLVPPERRSTLVASASAAGAYTFDIRIQGDGETVFFDV